jgi:hypothetical protein
MQNPTDGQLKEIAKNMEHPTDEEIRETVQRAYLHRQLREISKDMEYEQMRAFLQNKNKIDNLNFSETQINAKEKRKK